MIHDGLVETFNIWGSNPHEGTKKIGYEKVYR